MDAIRNIWRRRCVVCIASGPSLTLEDCERVRTAALPTIVTNTSFRLAPWADALFAMDVAWWKEYGDEVSASFKGDKKLSYVPARPDVIPTKGVLFPPGMGNSGSYAISLGVVSGATRILLLGYDCKFDKAGKKHWHSDHPGKMGNASSIARWPKQFALVARYAKTHGAHVVNCSRDTALTCFERGTLEEELSK